MNPPKLITNHIYPPIPIRAYDWNAYFDPEGTVGWGKTREEAIDDLRNQLNMEVEELD